MKKSEFAEKEYLAANPDVAEAVHAGQFKSGWHHYKRYGKREGRAWISLQETGSCEAELKNKIAEKLLRFIYNLSQLVEPLFDKKFLAIDVPQPENVSHSKWQQYLYEVGNIPGMRILEIGSREVTGKSDAREGFNKAEYIGFDYYPGNNVDVVGDVHKLSSYFSEDEKFDIVYSSACFEHFAMPWIVVLEIAKVLKVGGLIFIETHFSHSSHERPWHFFQFSDLGLKVLFSEALGFECIDSGMSNPIVGRFSSYADEYLKNTPVTGLYCHSEYLGRKIKDVEGFDWIKVDINDIIGETKYPEPKVEEQ